MTMTASLARPHTKNGAATDHVARAGIALSLEPGFDFLSPDYLDLANTSGATAFQSGLCLDSFYRHMLGAERALPVIVTARRADGRLEMVLPFIKRIRCGLLVIEIADCGVTDCFALPVRPDSALTGQAAQLCDQLMHLLAPFDLALLGKLASCDGLLADLFAGGQIETMSAGCHETALERPFKTWFSETLSRNYRKNLRRQGAALAAEGTVTFRVAEAPEDASGVLDQLRAFRTARFSDDVLASDHVHAFYRQLAVAGCDTGQSRVYVLELDGKVIAAEFGLVHENRFILLLGGADFDGYGKFGPGKQILIRMLEHLVDDGIAVADFSIGDEGYKKDFGTRRRPLYRLRYSHSAAGFLANAAFKPAKRLRAMQRALSEQLAT